MQNKNIYQALDAILRSASRNDKSRISRNIRLQNQDIALLENNYSERLSKILHNYWKNKLFSDANNYNDTSIWTFLLNRWQAESRRVRKNINDN